MGIADVAKQAGLTKGFVSKLERDQARASVASLLRLCQTLGISVGSLFEAARGDVVRHGSYPAINFGGHAITEHLLTPAGEKRVQAVLSELEPGGGSGAEPYALPADVEFVYVLAGQLRIKVAHDEIVLGRGDAFTFPPSIAHTFIATSVTGRTRVLWVFSPALPDTGRHPAGTKRHAAGTKRKATR
jgi:uncharacterized cupin superfamily protein